MTIFEVWSEDVNGHRFFVDSTNNRSEALKIAKQNLSEDLPKSLVMQEISEEEISVVERFSLDNQ